MTCPCSEKDSPGLQPAYDCHPQRLQNPEDTCVPRITAMTASSKSPWAEGRHGPTDLCIPPSLLLSLHVDSVHLAGPAATWAQGPPAIASTSSRRKLFRALINGSAPSFVWSSGCHPGALALQGTGGNVWSYLWLSHWETGEVLRVSGGQSPGMLLNIPRCTGPPPLQGILQPQMSAVLRLKKR